MTFSIGVIESDTVSTSNMPQLPLCENFKIQNQLLFCQVRFFPKLPNWKMDTIYSFKMARSSFYHSIMTICDQLILASIGPSIMIMIIGGQQPNIIISLRIPQ